MNLHVFLRVEISAIQKERYTALLNAASSEKRVIARDNNYKKDIDQPEIIIALFNSPLVDNSSISDNVHAIWNHLKAKNVISDVQMLTSTLLLQGDADSSLIALEITTEIMKLLVSSDTDIFLDF